VIAIFRLFNALWGDLKLFAHLMPREKLMKATEVERQRPPPSQSLDARLKSDAAHATGETRSGAKLVAGRRGGRSLANHSNVRMLD
jgi:hypothetical protein